MVFLEQVLTMRHLTCGLFVALAVSTWTRCFAFGVVPAALPCIKKGYNTRNSVSRQIPFTYTRNGDSDDDDDDDDTHINSSDPSNWFSDTRPFSIVRHFVPEAKVSDDDIERALEVNAIRTLRDLKEKCEAFIPLLRPGCIADFGSAIINAINRIRKTAEEILGEAKIVYDTSCITENAYKLYAPGAVSVDPTAFQETGESDKRYPEFSLVLGSSGSGKTLFAIKRIPQLIFGTQDEKNYFRIHFRARRVTDFMETYHETNPDKKLAFPNAVAMIVKDVIEKQLSGKGLDEVKTLSIPIHITIDEAGGDDNKPNFNTATKIRSIVEAIKAEGTFEFQKPIHVTVVGTRLEASTGDIASTRETTKFRMQPWTAKNFDALVDASSHSDKVRLKEVVHGFPILEDLITNARCAYFVLESMKDVSRLREDRVKSSVAVVVSSVADSYIMQNGLYGLGTPKQKWQVVRSVFRELDKSSRNRKFAYFPKFEDLEAGESDDLTTEDLRSIANSLLDVNVESKHGVPVLPPKYDFAISMTPAVAIVVASLVNANAKISWNWQGFETSIMLSEMKRMIVKSKEVPTHLDSLVLQLPSPLPAGRATKSFSIPVINNCTVVLNGPLAKYADVIAPFRLVQAKFSQDNTKPMLLNLQHELNKLGLTNSPGHVLQQWITKVVRTFWETGLENASWVKEEPIPNSVNKDERYECYPFNTLNSKIVLENPKVVSGVIDLKTGACVVKTDGYGEGFAFLAEFEHPVTAVFATNCLEYSFNVTKEKQEGDMKVVCQEKISIRKKDVDWEGKWENQGDSFSNIGLQDNVEIRFHFY